MFIGFVISIVFNLILVHALFKRRKIGTLVIDIFDGIRTPYLILNDPQVLEKLKEKEEVVLSVCRDDVD